MYGGARAERGKNSSVAEVLFTDGRHGGEDEMVSACRNRSIHPRPVQDVVEVLVGDCVQQPAPSLSARPLTLAWARLTLGRCGNRGEELLRPFRFPCV
jgi:hypothetical protein